ncbi:hypothetical protein FIBSPDRAFT_831374 [Athelia psychrophila]|uniref:Glycosyltransferase family 32 protein n=1 Tax=Athelia psychrophila TaxID=1759441 RepID=A0A166FIS4_9AGAM|nr:hypothetical protein FIBSPDRAFT_831374 [Fibularhizoctonia sp. CBS 109695]
MPSSVYMPTPQRGTGHRDKGRISPLPSYSSAVHEKHGHRQLPWTTPVTLPIPGVRTRRLRILVPNFARFHQTSVARFGRKKGPAVLAFTVFAFVFSLFALAKRFGGEEKKWPTASFGSPSTLVFGREELQRIWNWEIQSGHYPSGQKIPEQIGFTNVPTNPALPPRKPTIPARFRQPLGPIITDTVGTGPRRVYLDIQSPPHDVAYPPRPVPGSVADLDVIMEHCDFSQQKYVRDCLEILRLGGGLDSGNRLRRGKMDEWKYIYLEEAAGDNFTDPTQIRMALGNAIAPQITQGPQDKNAGLARKSGSEWESPLKLRDPLEHTPYTSLPAPCDEENPRLFHMFWTGPFTDKPYMALMSFLYTQNVGLNLHENLAQASVCQPQFWVWINPGPAAAVPNPSALRDMYDQLKKNAWAAPFLHPRFKDAIQFKLWNTTEQLDGVAELKNEWRALQETLFNSGGHIIEVPEEKKKKVKVVPVTSTVASASAASGNATEQQVDPSPTTVDKADDEDMFNRMGSKSSDSYDKLSVVLSDMARFILCHRFGGIYLDADTLLLRDWEELWGWKGAFAYRWSRLEKYNTAVLRMHKGSALGTFLFRTALQNGLDFHPMSVSRYTKDAYLEGLLLRLPDALFDSAWLNTEYYQRDRPPQPYFYEFADFFDTPPQNSAAPQALGFNGFFKGAYSYHYHNYWWKAFDSSRNFPDLGSRFIAGERLLRTKTAEPPHAHTTGAPHAAAEPEDVEDKVADDKRDLDWSTVMKRTFEAYIRGEAPNMYGEWIEW